MLDRACVEETQECHTMACATNNATKTPRRSENKWKVDFIFVRVKFVTPIRHSSLGLPETHWESCFLSQEHVFYFIHFAASDVSFLRSIRALYM